MHKARCHVWLMQLVDVLSLGDCLELTEARSIKTADAAQEVDGTSFGETAAFLCLLQLVVDISL